LFLAIMRTPLQLGPLAPIRQLEVLMYPGSWGSATNTKVQWKSAARVTHTLGMAKVRGESEAYPAQWHFQVGYAN